MKVPQKGLHPNMEPPFEATPKPKPTPAAAAAPAAAPAGDEPGKKKKGFLGSLSFRKGKNQKGAAADAEAKAQVRALLCSVHCTATARCLDSHCYLRTTV